MHFDTLAIHGGQHHDPSTGAVMPPIYQTSTYAQEAPGVHKGYEYSRTHNPTRRALENAIAAIEGGTHGLAFGSGLAAVDACMKLLKPGDHVVSTSDLYGGTYRLFTKVFEPFGLKFSFAPLADPTELRSLITPATKMVWLETPTNPMLNVLDIKVLADEAKKVGALVVVDNTFATPYLQRPLELGADIILHSATKYLGGHSDLILGLLAVGDESLAERLYFIQNAPGGSCGPMVSYMARRGSKTLHVRMDRHCQSAAAVAEYLGKHPAVRKVYYPGLKDHPGHEVAARQMKHFGGMVSFALHEDDLAKASSVVSALKVFTLAESLGGVESLAGHPATMTHASIPKAEREKTGVTDGLIRLSVGLEDVRDLTADLDQALSVLLT